MPVDMLGQEIVDGDAVILTLPQSSYQPVIGRVIKIESRTIRVSYRYSVFRDEYEMREVSKVFDSVIVMSDDQKTALALKDIINGN